jgi:acyl carrier protein
MSKEIEKRLKDCFRAVFPNLTEEQMSSASQATVGAWDSIATVTLVNMIDQEFGIGLDLDRLSELDSFTSIRACVENQVNVVGNT